MIRPGWNVQIGVTSLCLLLAVLLGLAAATPAARGALPGSPGLEPNPPAAAGERLRVIIETDAGGDPDDEQSLVRFLLYANEWDVEGVIANRPQARPGENRNLERTGLGIVRRLLEAYGECWTNLVVHDVRYPSRQQLWVRTVPGYNSVPDAVNLLLAAADRPDPRPIWYADWGTDHGAATNNLRRALDRVWQERGPAGYARFKARWRLASADAFGDHTGRTAPPFALWVDTFRPPVEGRRWYHRFSALTASAGGLDLERDVRTGHGALGGLYPVNTTLRQKEGDSMTFLYLVPTGMNDPLQPTWGSWAGRYGLNTNFPGGPYYWATELDDWHGVTNRDNGLARWAVALQNDFRARLDWCVARTFGAANHPPVAVLNGDRTRKPLVLAVRAGQTVRLSAAGSTDPDGQPFRSTWWVYPEAGTCPRQVQLESESGEVTSFVAPAVSEPATLHVILQIQDSGVPSLFAYRRAVVQLSP